MASQPTTSLKLSETVKERIQRLADARQRSAHWMMREAIEQYIDREEKREQLRQDVLASWQHYQETGLHIAGAEANAWLKRLARGEKPPLPEPHA